MGRQPRDEATAGYFAVRQKGDFFNNDDEKEIYSSSLKDAVERNGATLCGYAMGAGEVFIFVDCENISKLMQSINSSYVKRRNAAAKKAGEEAERNALQRYQVRPIGVDEIDKVLAFIQQTGGTIFMQTSSKLGLKDKIELENFKSKRITVKVEALDKTVHTHLKYHQDELPQTPFAQVVSTEVWEVAKNLPLVFTNEVVPTLVAMLGKDSNLMLDKDFKGQMPARLQNYPFMLAKVEEKIVLCIDSEAKQLKGDGVELFQKDGEYTEFTKAVIESMKNYSIDEERTSKAIQEIKKAGLLEEKDLSVTIEDKKITLIKGFSIVSKKKLAELDDKTLANFARLGYLELIYAHLHSLANLEILTARILDNEAKNASATK